MSIKVVVGHTSSFEALDERGLSRPSKTYGRVPPQDDDFKRVEEPASEVSFHALWWFGGMLLETPAKVGGGPNVTTPVPWVKQ